MRQARFGRIANVSSIGGRLAAPHMLPYTTSKFGADRVYQGTATGGASGQCVRDRNLSLLDSYRRPHACLVQGKPGGGIRVVFTSLDSHAEKKANI